MSTHIPRLRRSTAGTAVPAAPETAGILHLGLGSFHRAHQAVYTAAARDAGGADGWGIVGAASRSRSVVDALHAQDLLYSVASVSPEGTSVTVPAVHTDAFVAADEPARVVAHIADETIRIVTLTVTENGYSSSPATQHLDLDDAAIRADLAGGDPRTTIGQLARGLQARAASGAPISILSCDNLAANGAHTEKLVREFLGALPREGGAATLDFLDRSVAFPSSMVDRIVPATTPELRDRVAALRGLRDEAPVPAEPFTMWAIEDRFAAGRPAWEAGGAVFTDEVGRFEQMKVRLLNGTHSLIAYLGALQGLATIPEAIARTDVEEAARTVLRDEYVPSITVPTGVDIDAYQHDLFDRWANSALAHRTAQVGTDGSVKLRQRIPEPAVRMLAEGRMPHMIALTVAGYLSCLAPLDGFDPGVHAAAMTDAARPRLADAAASARDGRDLAARVISGMRLFGDDLAAHDGFALRVGELVDTIRRRGVDAAVADAVGASDDATMRTAASA
ncbi:mannitol dehydrogenase family protein [Microbacterium sp. EYE_5]|uniref:mannitol dehydrogenase family protein n=1 Tax=unclassified Microbacterium TaxID=2609290 RepID=UPI0020058D75|nr:MULTISPECIES: mannitol dehydrogenase family protein [unclassified Microbacterium]MCK6079832.1 mannitol dehydrogenase family protein [Microbacterium sp. EYE_382]MCK6085103.1 mannitol dehydrogenase family protein [Microbacterium sp. EYE_384]MCK6122671.1 mannitol dehydrogenase family protein [Microbacterium sp. EYE_80]MCK6125866.1 mannitol dehydrogenase family protein [Microbacterium sp. EYE_79]MCK6140787.1 mannitol dehydrogenase family protein [Microbacterium sp. EYE_39]